MTEKTNIEGLQDAIRETTTFRLETYFDIGKTFLDYIQDRLDKIFLDKYLLTKLLQRDIPVVAIFLHDVQRSKASRDLEESGDRHFNIASTFKTNHFLGYTVALNKLDGVYYVDPRPEMIVNEKLKEQIRDFQVFLTRDLWVFSK